MNIYLLQKPYTKNNAKTADRLLQCVLLNRLGKKQTLNDFLRKSGTIGSTERAAVSVRLFLRYFQFYQVEWRQSQVTVKQLVEYLFLFPMVGKLSKSINNFHSCSRKQSGTFFLAYVLIKKNFHDVQCLTAMTSSSH